MITVSPSGAWARTTPHGSTIIDAPVRGGAVGVRADLVGRDHEGLVLDRPRAQERLPVVLAGGGRERGRHGERSRRRPGVSRRYSSGKRRS